ncbi:MAG: winged helix-turn-helix transcriptional regulator [Verrucomicrobiaceae bacterium]|nr:winged helix-turn-helix transcriptional regulator [Verrucomicrobiaceae bacterium]
MSTPTAPFTPSPEPSPNPNLDQELVYEALGFTGRRLLLQRLASQGSCTAAELYPHSHLKRDNTSKHLQALVRAGLATMTKDPKDTRRLRYELTPHLKPTQAEDGHWELDFGFCLMRWRDK